LIGGLEFTSDLLHEREVEKGLIESQNLFVAPMNHSFCYGNALEVRKEERLFALHFLKDEIDGKDIKIFVIVVFPLKTRILFQYEVKL
jgi:hypothetical protein